VDELDRASLPQPQAGGSAGIVLGLAAAVFAVVRGRSAGARAE